MSPSTKRFRSSSAVSTGAVVGSRCKQSLATLPEGDGASLEAATLGVGGPGLQAHSLRVPCCIHGQAAVPSGIVKTAEAQGEGSLCRTLSLYLDRTAPIRVSSGCVPDPPSPPSSSALCPGSLHPLVLLTSRSRRRRMERLGIYCCPTGPRARVVTAEMLLRVPGAASSFLAPSPPTLLPPCPHKFSPLLPKWGVCLVLDPDRYNLPTDQKCLPVDQKITGSSLPTRGSRKRTGGEGEGPVRVNGLLSARSRRVSRSEQVDQSSVRGSCNAQGLSGSLWAGGRERRGGARALGLEVAGWREGPRLALLGIGGAHP